MDDSNPLFGLSLIPEGTTLSPVESAWSAYCTSLNVRHDQLHDPATVRAAFETVLQLPEQARLAATTLLQVAESFGADPAADAVLPVMTELIEHLPDELLNRLTRSLLPRERKRFAAATIAVVSEAAAIRLAHTIGTAFNASLSPPLSQLLHKLSNLENEYTEERRQRADQSLRGLLMLLVDGWAASSTNDALIEPRRWRVQPEPLRVVQLALEAQVMGGVVRSAVTELAHDELRTRALLTLAVNAPTSGPSADFIIDRFATPEYLRILLYEDKLDLAAVDALLSRLGASAARALLELLANAKERATRRALMDRLVALGPDIRPYVLEWTEDPRWYVVRNMIGLLREAGCSTRGIQLDQFHSHQDARVRRECLQLQLEHDAMRGPALVAALADSDRHILRIALQAARTDLPPGAVPVLAARLADPAFPAEFRVMSLHLLARSDSQVALDVLIGHVYGGRSLLGRTRLAPKTPEMLAALSGLARSWRDDRRAAELIALARKSKDEQILAALRGTPQA